MINRDIAKPIPGQTIDNVIKMAQNFSIIIGFGVIEEDESKLSLILGEK